MTLNRRDDNINFWEDFDSRWETKEKFLKNLIEFDIKKCEFKEISAKSDPKKFSNGGIPLYSNGTSVFVDREDVHTIIIGATGSKKTRLVGMPTLQILTKAGESFIATDPKGELYKRTAHSLQLNGYKTVIINLRETWKGNCWNPLSFPYELYATNQKENIDKARELLDDLARSIIIPAQKDQFWDNSAQNLFLGLCELLFKNCKNKNEINLKSICLLRAQAFTDKYLKSKYYDRIDKKSFEYFCLSGTVETADVTQGGILSVFDQHMRMFASQDALVELLSFTDIDFSIIGKEKVAIFLIIPDEKTTYHRLISVFIKQCYEHLIMNAQKMPDQKLSNRVNFVLDEFSSLPTIRDFPAMITASRSRNIRFNLIIQNKHQLIQRYGKEAETIKSNCANWIFLTSRELPLLEEVSKLAGNKNRDIPLISVSKLQRLEKDLGEALVFHGRCFPYVSKLVDIDEYSNATNEDVDIPKRDNKLVEVFDFVTFCKNSAKESIKMYSDIFDFDTPSKENDEPVKNNLKNFFDKKDSFESYSDIFDFDTPSKENNTFMKDGFQAKLFEEIFQKKICITEVAPTKYAIHTPMYKIDGGSYTIYLITNDNTTYLSDEGTTIEELDRIFELSEPDVIKNLVAILKQYDCKKVGKNIITECSPENLHIKIGHLIQAISFMLNMKIFYN
jgi:type IV secretion system protein VirD4